MYIRRKVFSKLQTEDGQERYFSTTEFTYMSEEEQREFAEKEKQEEDEKKAKRKKIAKKAAIGAGIAGAAYGGSKLTQRYISKKATSLSDALASGNLDESETQAANEQLRKLFRGERIAKKISNPVEQAGRGIANVGKTVGGSTVKTTKAAGKGIKKGIEAVAEAGKKAGKTVKESAEKAGKTVKNTFKKDKK